MSQLTTSLPRIMGLTSLFSGFISLALAYILVVTQAGSTMFIFSALALSISIVSIYITRKNITELQMSVAGVMFSAVASFI
jgi:hypothetical protein